MLGDVQSREEKGSGGDDEGEVVGAGGEVEGGTGKSIAGKDGTQVTANWGNWIETKTSLVLPSASARHTDGSGTDCDLRSANRQTKAWRQWSRVHVSTRLHGARFVSFLEGRRSTFRWHFHAC